MNVSKENILFVEIHTMCGIKFNHFSIEGK